MLFSLGFSHRTRGLSRNSTQLKEPVLLRGGGHFHRNPSIRIHPAPLLPPLRRRRSDPPPSRRRAFRRRRRASPRRGCGAPWRRRRSAGGRIPPCAQRRRASCPPGSSAPRGSSAGTGSTATGEVEIAKFVFALNHEAAQQRKTGLKSNGANGQREVFRACYSEQGISRQEV